MKSEGGMVRLDPSSSGAEDRMAKRFPGDRLEVHLLCCAMFCGYLNGHRTSLYFYQCHKTAFGDALSLTLTTKVLDQCPAATSNERSGVAFCCSLRATGFGDGAW